MSFQPGAALYTQGFGTRPEGVEVPFISDRAPTTSDINFPVGKRWMDTTTEAEYSLASFTSSGGVLQASWVLLGGGSSDVNTLDGDTGSAVPTGGAITIAGGSGITTSASGSTVTVALSGGSLAIDSFVPDAGTNPVVPTAAGAVTMAGTANQITTTGGLNTLTFSLPSAITTPGSLTTTTGLTAGSGFTVSAGAVSVTTGTSAINVSADAANTAINIGTGAGVKTLTLGSTNTTSATSIQSGSGGIGLVGAVTATTGDVVVTRSSAGANVLIDVTNSDNTSGTSNAYFEAAVGGTSSGDAATRYQISGGQNWTVGLDNSASDAFVIAASNTLGTSNAASWSTAGALTNAGSITATTGNIQATAGNLVLAGAATQMQIEGGAVTDFIGTAILVNGTVTVANTNIAATDQVYVTREGINASTALGVFNTAITASTSFTITALNPTDGTTQTNDVSTVKYVIFRQL